MTDFTSYIHLSILFLTFGMMSIDGTIHPGEQALHKTLVIHRDFSGL